MTVKSCAAKGVSSRATGRQIRVEPGERSAIVSRGWPRALSSGMARTTAAPLNVGEAPPSPAAAQDCPASLRPPQRCQRDRGAPRQEGAWRGVLSFSLQLKGRTTRPASVGASPPGHPGTPRSRIGTGSCGIPNAGTGPGGERGLEQGPARVGPSAGVPPASGTRKRSAGHPEEPKVGEGPAGSASAGGRVASSGGSPGFNRSLRARAARMNIPRVSPGA